MKEVTPFELVGGVDLGFALFFFRDVFLGRRRLRLLSLPFRRSFAQGNPPS